MSLKKLISTSVALGIISISTGCSTSQNLTAVPQQVVSQSVQVSAPTAPVAPKIHLNIKKAEIEVTEEDLNIQFKSIMELSDEKRIQDAKLTILPNSVIKGDGIILQKVPLVSNPLKIPFSVEGSLSVLPKNVIKFEPTKIKVAGISVKSFMDVLGIELANITKFKDHFGRIELSGNSFLLIVEKFTDDAIIVGQIKDVKSSEKALTIIF